MNLSLIIQLIFFFTESIESFVTVFYFIYLHFDMNFQIFSVLSLFLGYLLATVSAIYGGEDAPTSPFFVQIQKKQRHVKWAKWETYCGGTLITPRAVVTIYGMLDES